jgi:hypothetical protein
VLACDEGNHRDDLPVEHFTFSKDELADWTFGGRFGHGAKIGALKKAADIYGGKLALIDTDTFFLRSPAGIFDRIDERHVVMHHDEGPLARHGQFQTFRPLMASQSGQYLFHEESHMFNSGLVGICAEHLHLLDEARRLTGDLLDAAGPLHTLEQFSLGIVLGSHFNIRTADDIVRHYTGWKRRFVHARITEIEPDFSDVGFARALAKRDRMDEPPPRRAIDTLRSKLKAWQRHGLADYEFAYLCYLSAFHAASQGEANAWAGTALDFVGWNRYPRAIVGADFSALSEGRLETLRWLHPLVRGRWAAYWREFTTTSPASR